MRPHCAACRRLKVSFCKVGTAQALRASVLRCCDSRSLPQPILTYAIKRTVPMSVGKLAPGPRRAMPSGQETLLAENGRVVFPQPTAPCFGLKFQCPLPPPLPSPCSPLLLMTHATLLSKVHTTAGLQQDLPSQSRSLYVSWRQGSH